MRRGLKILALVLCSIVILSLLNFALAVHPYRFRSDTTPAHHGIQYEPVRFRTSDGIVLAGWFVPALIETNRTVIVGHGYPFDKGDVLASTLFLTKSFNLLFYDHRYFGESEGSFTTVGMRETRDVEAALDHLESRGLDGPVGAFGFSFSASVMLMTEDGRIDALVAEAPYASLEHMVDDQYRFLVGPLKWPFTGLTAVYSKVFFGAWPSDVSPKQAAHRTDRPTLLIHGTSDSQIPFTHAQAIMSSASDSVELWAVEDGDHGGIRSTMGTEYETKVMAFFEKNLGAVRELPMQTHGLPPGGGAHSSTGSLSGPATTLPSSSTTWITSTGQPSAAASASSSSSSLISFSQISPFCSPPSRSALLSSVFSVHVSGSAATQMKKPSQFSRS